MANLLPRDSQKYLRRAQRARLMLALALSVFAAALIVFATLLPASVALYLTSPAGSAVGSRAAVFSEGDRGALREMREMISALKPIAIATTTPTQTLMRVLSLKPAAVAIDHMTYIAGPPSTLTLYGVSGSPSALNAYRGLLAADPHFPSVSVPVGALIGAENGRFTMTITGNF